MIVSQDTFDEIVDCISNDLYLAADTETTGLFPHLGDRLFSLILATSKESYYFNFQRYPGVDEKFTLPRKCFERIHALLQNPQLTVFMHNAKFDLAMLAYEGVFPACQIHDTEVAARLIYNQHMVYSLAECAKRIMLNKSNAVEEYISKKGLFTWKDIPGKKKRVKIPHYDQVPFEVIAPYGETDGEITFKLGMWQLEELQKIHSRTPSQYPSIMNVYEADKTLVNTCLSMEFAGIKIDRDYCEEALAFELDCAEKAKKKFQEISGMDFVDSGKGLAKAFDAAGENYPKTSKGNPSFTDEVLTAFDSPLANAVRGYRKSNKRAGTYYQNFLEMADDEDRIHANIRMAGTDTSRFSYSEPNLQNVPKREPKDLPYHVRRAFIPQSEDYCFVMIDFDQQEYRLLMDYARPQTLIDAVIGGLDVHAATAEKMGVDRDSAKTLNFQILYGGGDQKLADSLNVQLFKAKRLREDYFVAIPEVRHFIKSVTSTAKRVGRLISWNGFPFHFPDPDFAYKGPNHMIQGGCAQIMRRAMPLCAKALLGSKSRMILQVHDELIFEFHKDDLHLIPQLVEILESAYPHRHLPLTCSVSHSWKSWYDKVDGLPVIAA